MKRKNKAQYYIIERYDRPVSKREFLQKRGQEVEKSYVSQKHLLKIKTLSLNKIKSFEKKGILIPIRHKRKKYFKKDEVIALMEQDYKKIKPIRQINLFEK